MPIDPTRRQILQGVAGGGLAANTGAITASGNPVNEHAGEYNVGTLSDDGRQEAEDQADEVIRVLSLESEQIVVGVYDPESVSELRNHSDIEFVEENETISLPEPPEEGPPDGEEAEQVEEEEGVTIKDEEEAREDGRAVEEEGEAQPELLTGRYTYAAERIGVPEAHDRGERGEGAHIAIIDTGIESTHFDLEENLGEGLAITECQEADCNEPWDDAATHGTWVAGVAAAAGNGITGVAPEATIHAIRAGGNDASEYFPRDQVAEGIIWATDQGYDIVNMSLGSQENPPLILERAIQYAYDNGVLIVSSAGNAGPCTDCIGSPGAGSTEIAVGASGLLSPLASFSSTGSEIELVAPGQYVRTSNNGLFFQIWWGHGTSIAAPFVSGVAALLMSNGFSNEEARTRMQETAEDIGLSENEQGYGRVNALAVLDDPLVRTNLVEDVENESATLRGELVYLGSEGSAEAFFQYREQGDEEWERTSTESHTEGVEFDTTVDDLQPGTDYEYRLAASAEENSDHLLDTGDVQSFSTPQEGTASNGPYLLAFITDADASRSDYRFVAEGEIDPVEDGYESPSGNEVRSVSNYSVESETADTWVAEGHTGNGYGDLFQVHGPIANVTVDDEDAMWVELDEEEIDPDDLRDETGAESDLVAFVSESDADEAEYFFAAEGEMIPLEKGYDSPSGNEVRSVSNYDVEHESGDTWTTTGDTGNGFGDAYRVYDSVTDAKIADTDQMWLERNREEVEPDEIIDADPEFTEVAFISEPDAGQVNYEFTADGEIIPAEVGLESPSGNPVRSVSNFEIQENETWSAEGHTGNGHGDLYRVYSDVEEDRISVDQPDEMWVEIDGDEVGVGENDIEQVNPETELTIEPETSVLFEATVPDSVDIGSVQWDSDDGVSWGRGDVITSYLQGEYTDYATEWLTFDDQGTYEVTASLPDDSDYEGTSTWTVTVEEGGTSPPQIENIETDPPAEDGVLYDEMVEYSVTAEDPEGDLDRVIWQETDNEVTLPDVSDLSGERDSSSFEVVAGDSFWLRRGGGFPVLAVVVSENGLIADDTVDSPAARTPFEVSIEDTNEPVEPGETLSITVEVENQSSDQPLGVAEQVQEIELDVNDESGVDSESVELRGEEPTEVTLSYEVGPNEEGDLEVTVRSRDDEESVTIDLSEEIETEEEDEIEEEDEVTDDEDDEDEGDDDQDEDGDTDDEPEEEDDEDEDGDTGDESEGGSDDDEEDTEDDDNEANDEDEGAEDDEEESDEDGNGEGILSPTVLGRLR